MSTYFNSYFTGTLLSILRDSVTYSPISKILFINSEYLEMFGKQEIFNNYKQKHQWNSNHQICMAMTVALVIDPLTQVFLFQILK